MKLLLLFTLLSAACYGQDTVLYNQTMGEIDYSIAKTRVVVNGRLVYDTAGNLVGYETGDLFNGQYHELPSLEEKLLLYAQECYNDSTLSEVPYNCSVIGCLVDHPPIKKYIHRKPTFENFIEWLKNK